jgi:ATP synthase protein I
MAMTTADPNHLDRSVRRARERRERAKREGERTIAQNLAWMGTLGWLVVVPTLAGMFLGRWLDERFGTGVMFSLALCIGGLTAGCALAWRKVKRR